MLRCMYVPSDWLIVASCWPLAAAAAWACLMATRPRCPDPIKCCKHTLLLALFAPPCSCCVTMLIGLLLYIPHNEHTRDMPSDCNFKNKLARGQSKLQALMSSTTASATRTRTTCLAAPYPPPTGVRTRCAIACIAPKAMPVWLVGCVTGDDGNSTAA